MECVHLIAVYQVHIAGYAYRFKFHNTKLLYPPDWKINVPNIPHTFYEKNFYHFIWFYSKSSGTIQSKLSSESDVKFDTGRRVNRSVIQQPTAHTNTLTYVFIEHFTCLTKKSVLHVQDGLAQFSSEGRWSFQCSMQHQKILAAKKHRYMRVDLFLHILDPNVTFIMTLKAINVTRKLCMTNVMENGVSIYMSDHNYETPVIYSSIDSYLTVTVTSFMYSGPHLNVMADHVHSLPLLNGEAIPPDLPKGT
jgi:hypothetical protein